MSTGGRHQAVHKTNIDTCCGASRAVLGLACQKKIVAQDCDPSLFSSHSFGDRPFAVSHDSDDPPGRPGNRGCIHGISIADLVHGTAFRNRSDFARSGGRRRTSPRRKRKTPVGVGIFGRRPCPNQEGLDKGRRAMRGCRLLSWRCLFGGLHEPKPRSLTTIGVFSSLSSRKATTSQPRSLVWPFVD